MESIYGPSVGSSINQPEKITKDEPSSASKGLHGRKVKKKQVRASDDEAMVDTSSQAMKRGREKGFTSEAPESKKLKKRVKVRSEGENQAKKPPLHKLITPAGDMLSVISGNLENKDLASLRQSSSYLKTVADTHMSVESAALQALHDGCSINKMRPEIRNNGRVALNAVTNTYKAYDLLNDALKKNLYIVATAISSAANESEESLKACIDSLPPSVKEDVHVKTLIKTFAGTQVIPENEDEMNLIFREMTSALFKVTMDSYELFGATASRDEPGLLSYQKIKDAELEFQDVVRSGENLNEQDISNNSKSVNSKSVGDYLSGYFDGFNEHFLFRPDLFKVLDKIKQSNANINQGDLDLMGKLIQRDIDLGLPDREAMFQTLRTLSKAKENGVVDDFIRKSQCLNDASLKAVVHTFRNDRELLLELVRVQPKALNFLPEKFKDDKAFFSNLLKIDPYLIEFASERLKGDRQLIQSLMAQDPQVLRFASKKLQLDPELNVMAATQIAEKSILPHVDILCNLAELNLITNSFKKGLQKSYQEYIQKNNTEHPAVVGSPIYSLFFGKIKNDDFDAVRRACNEDGRALQFASPELRANKEVVMLAVLNNPDAYRFASYTLQNDPDIRRVVEGNPLEDILDLS